MGRMQSNLTVVLVCLVVIACQQAPGIDRQAEHGRLNKMPELEERMASIRAGEQLSSDIDTFLENGRLSDFAAKSFATHLDASSPEERESLVIALAAIGRGVDALAQPGTLLLREPRVIELLSGPGLRAAGSARDASLDALSAAVPPALLRAQGQALAEDLERSPDSAIFRLVAKAKPPEARDALNRLLADPTWQNDKSARIAAAAYGDTQAEGEFIRAFQDAADATSKADAAQVLAAVATRPALEELARAMRSDLVYEMPMVMRRSVRVDIVAALSSVYPEQTILWDNAVDDDSDYARIEAFCEQEFGTRWSTPRPPFLWIEGMAADHEE